MAGLPNSRPCARCRDSLGAGIVVISYAASGALQACQITLTFTAERAQDQRLKDDPPRSYRELSGTSGI